MKILDFVRFITFLDIVKLLLVLLLLVYTVFALLMMKQVSAMTKAVTMKDDLIIRVLGMLNFVFALFVLVVAIFIL